MDGPKFDPELAFFLGQLVKKVYQASPNHRQLTIEGYRMVKKLFATVEFVPELFGAVFETLVNIMVVFRGTVTIPDWLEDFSSTQDDFPYVQGVGKVHHGFISIYRSVREPLIRTLSKCLPGKKLYVTGHSLGGALATLAALDIAANTAHHQPVMYNFGSPRVGDPDFARAYNQLVPMSFRIINLLDIVAELPPEKVKIPFSDKTFSYKHTATPVVLLTQPGNVGWNHSMSTYLNAL